MNASSGSNDAPSGLSKCPVSVSPEVLKNASPQSTTKPGQPNSERFILRPGNVKCHGFTPVQQTLAAMRVLMTDGTPTKATK